jgi:hypothetical protein
LQRRVLRPKYARSPKGLDPRVVCSMHRLFGKGYASGGGRLRFGAEASAVASSRLDPKEQSGGSGK